MDLPAFPAVAPDPSVRDVEPPRQAAPAPRSAIFHFIPCIYFIYLFIKNNIFLCMFWAIWFMLKRLFVMILDSWCGFETALNFEIKQKKVFMYSDLCLIEKSSTEFIFQLSCSFD